MSLWQLGGLTWKELAKRVYSEIGEDDVWGRSAQLSYYFLLALFPLLLFLTSVIGLVIGSGTGIRHALFDYLGRVLPGSASALVSNTMREVSVASGGGKLAFGLLAALWAASNGMTAMSETLNVAYEVEESRPWWKVRLNAILMTLFISVLVISALVIILFGGRIIEAVAARLMLGDVFTVVWKILQWPLALAFVLLAFALIYYMAPDVKDKRWHWVTPGAVVGVALWLLVSLAFRLYLSYFDSYSATYGSLGAVIVLMLWFYLTGAAILIGGETNSEIALATERANAPPEQQQRRRTDTPAGGEPEGQKTPGEIAAAHRREERARRKAAK